MLAQIANDQSISPFLTDTIQENGVCVCLHSSLFTPQGHLDLSQIVNIAVDQFYNSQHSANTPKSIDNLVIISRGSGKYSMSLIELKDVSKLSRLNADDIYEKFQNSIEDFLRNKLGTYCDESAIILTDLNLWLVCNRFGFLNGITDPIKYEKRVRETLIEILFYKLPFKFGRKIAAIQHMPSGQVLA